MSDGYHVYNMIPRDQGCGKRSIKIDIGEKPVSWQRKTGNSSPPELREQTAHGRKAHAMRPEGKVLCRADKVKGLNCQRQGF